MKLATSIVLTLVLLLLGCNTKSDQGASTQSGQLDPVRKAYVISTFRLEFDRMDDPISKLSQQRMAAFSDLQTALGEKKLSSFLSCLRRNESIFKSSIAQKREAAKSMQQIALPDHFSTADAQLFQGGRDQRAQACREEADALAALLTINENNLFLDHSERGRRARQAAERAFDSIGH